MTKYYPKKDYSSNLVAKWIFDNTNSSYVNGNTIYDLSGKGNNLTAYNLTYKDDVDLGRCAYFNGTNAYCKSMKNISNGRISLTIKFKQTGLTGEYQTIISPQTTTNGYMSGLYVYIHKDTGNIVSEYSVSRFSNWSASTKLLTNTENIIGLNKSYDITFTFNNIKNDKNASQVFINNLSKILKKEVNEVADNIQYLMTIGKHSSEYWYYNGYIQSIEIYDEAIEFANNKYLIRQNNQYYTIKSEFHKNGDYRSITELKGKEILEKNDFETYGIDDLNSLTEAIDIQVINSIDKGSLGNGKLFEMPFSNDFLNISEVK